MLRFAIAAAIVLAHVPAAFSASVVSRSGARASVASMVSSKFQCLVDALDAVGYKIKYLGGWRPHGSVPHSLHPSGLALDVNQVRRNVTIPPMPKSATSMASKCGLLHGAVWHNADAGHFEVVRDRRRDAYASGVPLER